MRSWSHSPAVSASFTGTGQILSVQFRASPASVSTEETWSRQAIASSIRPSLARTHPLSYTSAGLSGMIRTASSNKASASSFRLRVAHATPLCTMRQHSPGWSGGPVETVQRLFLLSQGSKATPLLNNAPAFPDAEPDIHQSSRLLHHTSSGLPEHGPYSPDYDVFWLD